MKHLSALISTLSIVFILVTFSHGAPPKQTALHSATKGQVNAMQKQLVKNAKAVMKITKKDIKTSNIEYRATLKVFQNALKADEKAHDRMIYGKTQKIRVEGRKEVAITSKRLVEAENALLNAAQKTTQAQIKHGQAKQNLNGIRKQGWQQFFENQRTRTSITLPRLVRKQGGDIDKKRFKKELKKTVHQNTYAAR